MDPFATLGLPRRYDVDREQLESRYRELQKKLHPDRFAAAPASERRLSLARAVEVNEAYRTLRDDLMRAEALLTLTAAGLEAPAQPSDPEFLMDMMELRESLAEAAAAQDLERVRELSARVADKRDVASIELRSAFDEGPAASARARERISELKFYRRFLEQVEVIEEEAQD